MTSLVAIAIEAAKDISYSWLIAASLPPALYFLTKKMHSSQSPVDIRRRKQSWVKKLIMKWAMKKVAKRVRKRKKMSDGAATLIAILVVLGLGALLVWLLGWLWAVVIVFVAGLLIYLYGGD